MADTNWMIRAHEFVNCNCAVGCPCQFNGLPTQGNCKAVVGIKIHEGYHGSTRLDGLNVAAAFSWPKAIHEGNGEAVFVLDKRATSEQRDALLRILNGQDTEPGATIFNVFATTLKTVHEPVIAEIDFEIDIAGRTAHLAVPDRVAGRGEPIRNPVTGAEHRIRIDNPNGFEFHLAEVGRGSSAAQGPVEIAFENTHAHFCELNLSQSGVVA
jgi:hypothetical protein